MSFSGLNGQNIGLRFSDSSHPDEEGISVNVIAEDALTLQTPTNDVM